MRKSQERAWAGRKLCPMSRRNAAFTVGGVMIGLLATVAVAQAQSTPVSWGSFRFGRHGSCRRWLPSPPASSCSAFCRLNVVGASRGGRSLGLSHRCPANRRQEAQDLSHPDGLSSRRCGCGRAKLSLVQSIVHPVGSDQPAPGVSFSGGGWERQHAQQLLDEGLAERVLRIHSATYGFRDSVNDVASVIRGNTRNESVDMLVSNEMMGGIPVRDATRK